MTSMLRQLHSRWADQNLTIRFLRILLAMGLVSVVVVMPRFFSGQRLQLIGLIPIAGASVLLLLKYPPLGLLVLIIASFLVPISIGTGTGTSINATILVLVMTTGLWFLRNIRTQDWQLTQSSVQWPTLMLLAISALAFVIGNQPWYLFARTAPLPAQLGGLALIVLSILAFFLVATLIDDIRWLKVITWTFVSLGSLYIVGRLLPPGYNRTVLRYFQSGAVNSMFWVWLVALSLSQAIFNRKLQLYWRIFLVALVTATLYVGYVQTGEWKSGWVPAAVVTVCIIIYRFRQISLLAVGLGLISVPQIVNQLIATDQYSYSTRLDAWLLVLEIFKVNPVLGLGPANYYWYTPLFPIRGYAVQFNSHSQYIDLLAQTGILGLLAFLWFAFEIGRLGWRLLQRVPEGFSQAYVVGALSGLVGTLVAAAMGDWVIPFVYNVGFNGFRGSIFAWLFLGGLVVIEKLYFSEQTDGSNSEGINLISKSDSPSQTITASQ